MLDLRVCERFRRARSPSGWRWVSSRPRTERTADQERCRLHPTAAAGRSCNQLTAAQQQQQVADALERRLDNSLSERMAGSTRRWRVSSSPRRDRSAPPPLRPASRHGRSQLWFDSSTPPCNVGGFNVNVAIAPQLTALLAAFSTTGHKLGGGAYRSSILCCASHCGSDPYSIYHSRSQMLPPRRPRRAARCTRSALPSTSSATARSISNHSKLLHVVGGQRSRASTAEPAVGAVALEYLNGN